MRDDPAEIMDSLISALPEYADPRSELAALGMVATGVICATPREHHADLVETFCNMLRAGVGVGLHS